MAGICREDCNPVRALVYTLLFASPIINALIIVLLHKYVINLLTWITDIFMKDFWLGLGIVQAITMVTVPLNIPYTLTAIFLAYCMAMKFGSFTGLLIDTLIDPIIFSLASIFPFVATRLFCKDCLRELLVSKMRVIRALEASFDTHGIKIVSIFRMIPGNKMSQNYFLAVTKLKFSSYMIGTYVGSHPMSLITAYIGTQIKSIEEVVHGGSEKFSIV